MVKLTTGIPEGMIKPRYLIFEALATCNGRPSAFPSNSQIICTVHTPGRIGFPGKWPPNKGCFSFNAISADTGEFPLPASNFKIVYRLFSNIVA
jgi:hypothetical protein